MAKLGCTVRAASGADITALTTLILEHGPNHWNYLPERQVREHVARLADGNTMAVVAEEHDRFLGVVTYEIGNRHPQNLPPGEEEKEHGYIAEAVVHRDHTGQGIGTWLLRAAVQDLVARGIRVMYARRHEENDASARMMEKCGFRQIDLFDDPTIRPTGSRRTAVCQLIL